MSKSTKIVAGLGVAAALGIAALPAAGIFAAEPSVSGDNEVNVVVGAAIAMAIEGSDSTSPKVVQYTNGTAGDNEFVASTDPLYAAATTAASSTENIKPNTAVLGDGGTTSAFGSKITVWTNKPFGYNLSVAANTSADLINAAATTSDKFEPITAVTDLTSPDYSANLWGYRVLNADRSTTLIDWAGMSTTAATIRTENGTKQSGEVTNVDYGAVAKGNIEVGTYSTTLTYTATTNATAPAAP